MIESKDTLPDFQIEIDDVKIKENDNHKDKLARKQRSMLAEAKQKHQQGTRKGQDAEANESFARHQTLSDNNREKP